MQRSVECCICGESLMPINGKFKVGWDLFGEKYCKPCGTAKYLANHKDD